MSRHVLVVNCGSSSLKYQLVDVDAERSVTRGLVERIGDGGPTDHEEALRQALDDLGRDGPGLDAVDLVAVGHRVVHGGERFQEPALVDDDVVAAIRELVPLAPLHNPANATGIEVARKVLPDVPHVAVFDTAFHATLPPAAATYAIDRDLARAHSIRRYGFHGTSHAYVSRRTAQLLGREQADVNVVVLHLGNGASASAVAGGRCVDTSMGLTPLQGLVMGTRSGDIDPAVVFHLVRVAGLSLDDVDDLLNKRSGLLGLTGQSDLREVWRLADAGDADAALALDVYCYRIRSYVGAYTAVLGRVDAIAFTAGVGEHDARVRARALAGLEPLGVVLDPARNAAASDGEHRVSADGSAVSVFVVPTDEELEIARESLVLVRP